jgi:hypothetical protein
MANPVMGFAMQSSDGLAFAAPIQFTSGSLQFANTYAATVPVKRNDAVFERKQCEIAALADIATWVKLVADLTYDDIAGDDIFTAETFDAAAL